MSIDSRRNRIDLQCTDAVLPPSEAGSILGPESNGKIQKFTLDLAITRIGT